MLSKHVDGLAEGLDDGEAALVEARRAIADLARDVERVISAARACCPPTEFATSGT